MYDVKLELGLIKIRDDLDLLFYCNDWSDEAIFKIAEICLRILIDIKNAELRRTCSFREKRTLLRENMKSLYGERHLTDEKLLEMKSICLNTLKEIKSIRKARR